MAWATIANVADVTGETVTDAEITRATYALETVIGLIESVTRADLTDRDAHFLMLAVAYQTAWMRENPDVFTREDAAAVTQDGASASYRNPDAHTIAPLARKAIRRLSWRGLRAVIPGGPTPPRSSLVRDPLSDASDDQMTWG